MKKAKRVKSMLNFLLENKQATAVDIARFVGCINPYNYISYARHEYNIPIIKEKKPCELLHKYRIEDCAIDKANKIIKGDAVTSPLNCINQQGASINSGVEL